MKNGNKTGFYKSLKFTQSFLLVNLANLFLTLKFYEICHIIQIFSLFYYRDFIAF